MQFNKKIFATCVFALALGCFNVFAVAPSAPTETRIIDSFSQLGVDSPLPRFGWVVNDSDRNERQSACQIIVATNETDIDLNVGSAWNSAKLATNLQAGVVYSGAPLSSAGKYWFKVRTWDKDDQVSPWSTKTSFVTGFFQPSDWASGIQWIKHPLATTGKTNANPPAMFRKEFQIAKPVKQAHLFVCGLGQFVASLNGAKVGNNEMDPAWTDYDVTANYVAFDVTAQIQSGANALGVMLGHGWYGYPGADTRDFGSLKLWAQLRIDFTDGTSSNLVTDTSWKAATSPWGYTEVHGAETYDARLEQVGWNTPGFNDGSWPNAVVAAATGALAAQNAPPIRSRQIYLPARISNPAANVYLYDFGQVINGQYEITVSGTSGMVVTLLTAEYLKSNGRAPAPGNNSNRTGYSTYTLKGGGPETWRLTFTATGFRYLEISGVTTNAANTSVPLVQVVKAFHLCNAARDVGSFSASDVRYEQIHKQALITMENCLQSVHMDGPNHERLGWQEVVWTTVSSAAYYHDVQTLWTKLMRDVREAQRVSGLCPDIAPNWFHTTNDAPGDKYDDAPAWGSSLFIASWFIYQNYGDRKILDDNYRTMTNYLAYLKTKEVGGCITYGLGDWMAAGGTPVANVEGAVYVYDTGLMRDIATVLGKTSDAAFYANEYIRVRDAYNAALFDANSQTYVPMNQANQAIPLVFGIVPGNSVAAVQQALVNDIAAPQENGSPTSYGSVGEFGPILPDHVTAGDIGVTPLWRALGDAGQHDLVQTMIMQPTSPSYLAMLNAGETCITENWNLAKARSHSHDMYAGIFDWLYRTLGGISSAKPGYEEIQLKPGMPSGLTNLSCAYQSVRGNISSAWTINSNQVVTWNIQIPANATAKVFVPVPGTSTNKLTITESGTLIWTNNAAVGSVTGLTFDHVESGFVVWRVGSGSYQFSWRITPAPTGLSATAGQNKILLSWNPVSGATQYRLKRSITAGGPYALLASGLTATNFADTAVTNGVTFYYVASAVFPDNESVESSPASAATFNDATIAIFNDSFSRGTSGSPLNLNSTAPDVVNLNAATWLTPAGFSTDGSEADNTGNSALVAGLPFSGLQPGLTYKLSANLKPTYASDATRWIGIAFVNANNAGSIFTNAIAFLLARRNGSGQTFYGDPGLNNALEIPGSGGTNAFDITLALDATGAGTLFFSQNGISFRTGNLTSNQVAQIRAVGIAANGSGSFDNFQLAVSPPAAPAHLQAAAGDGQAILSWSASLGASAYTLKRSATAGGFYAPIATNLTLNFTNTGLSNGTLYHYVVSALSGAGESADSMAVVARPMSATPPSLSWLNSGSLLQLDWPLVHTGWQLQCQTSNLTTGLGTNWTLIAASDSTNQMLFPVSRNDSVFFRLIHPN